MTDERLSQIAERHRERREFRRHIPSGPYFYDSLGYIHNELAMRPSDTPASRATKPGILVRSDEWFQGIDMDARLKNADREIAGDLGQYIALSLDHDVEDDIADLLAEVRRLRASRRA